MSSIKQQHTQTAIHNEETDDLAISVSNQVAICGCEHCIQVYKRAKGEYLLTKAKLKEKEIPV